MQNIYNIGSVCSIQNLKPYNRQDIELIRISKGVRNELSAYSFQSSSI